MDLQEFEKSLLPKITEPETHGDNQRTEQWHRKRLGQITGSGIKLLMTSKSKKPRLWSDYDKLIDLGDTALEYIMTRAIERASDDYIPGAVTYAMHRGTELEPEAKAWTQKTEQIKITEFGYVPFLKNAGASPDGGIVAKDGTILRAIEVKCPEKHSIHINYKHYEPDQKHQYFWQFQAEMIALGVSKLDFYSYHPFFPEHLKLIKKTVTLSELHQTAMFLRIIIGERVVNRLVETDFLHHISVFFAEVIKDVPKSYDDIIAFVKENIKPLLIEKGAYYHEYDNQWKSYPVPF